MTNIHLGHVDALARLQLGAKRFGVALLVTNASDDLVELIGFVGLPIEMRGQPECSEQLGVQEVVQPGDASA